jgi:AraC-like DNA-binding protein
MPCFASRTLWRSDTLRVERVGCDGSDARRPGEEEVRGDAVWLVLAGRFELRTRAGRVVADPTTALCKRQGEAYSVRHPDGGDVCLAVRGELASRLVGERPGAQRLHSEGYLRLAAAARGLAAGDAHAVLALEEALAHAFEPLAPRTALPHERRTADAIAHAVQLGFDQRRPLAELAAAAGVSVFHACRAFQRARGTSIHQHVLEVRLRHALALVVDGEQPLAEVAAATGFASQAHLTSRFTRRFGRPPGALRRQPHRPPAGPEVEARI